MSRSARSALTGIHLQLLSGARVSDLNCRAYTVLDESAPFLPELRQRIPDARICLRLLQNSRWGDPEGTARAGAALIAAYPQADYLTPGNEQNLENAASMAQIADWSRRFLDEWQRQGSPRPAVTPAISPGASYDLSQLRDAWARYPVIGVHAYWSGGNPADPAPALAQVTAHRQVWPDKPQWIGELNCGLPGEVENDQAKWGPVTSATDRFMSDLAGLGYVLGATWFVDDSRDQPYRLVRIPPLMDLYRRLGHEQGGGPTPEPPPADAIAVKYNLVVIETPYIGVRFEDDMSGQVELVAVMAPGTTGSLRTGDGQHGVDGPGTLAVVMADTSKYFPENGQHGPWNATCAGARVEGLGMKPSHEHPRTTFFKKSTPQPPETGYTWSGAFAQYAADHRIGPPTGPIAYIPNSWVCAAQENEKVLLIWNGWGVSEVGKG